MPPVPVEPPHAYRFNRRRTNFSVNVEEAFERPRRGMRNDPAVTQGKNREADFQRWLARVGGTGTRPEFMGFRALERRGLRAPESEPFPGIDFQFQVPVMGGRGEQGGAVIDLMVYVTAPPTAIRVQGEYFHFGDDAAEVADIMEKLALQSEGYQVVDVLAQDLLDEDRADYVIGLALNGFQLEFSGRLGVFK